MDIYTDNPLCLIAVVPMFVIIFTMVNSSLRHVDLFSGSRVIMASCVSLLCMLGMDQAVIRPILSTYAAMGTAMLFVLALLLLLIWLRLSKMRGRGAR